MGPYHFLGITDPTKFSETDRVVLAPAKLNPAGGKDSDDDSLTDATLVVDSVSSAIRLWQQLAKNKLGQIGDAD